MPPRTRREGVAGVARLTRDPHHAQVRAEYFKTLTTPIAEAFFDIELFLDKYFRDENGNPDQSKTPEAVILSGLTAAHKRKLEKAAAEVPNLICETRGFDEYEAFYLGWSKEAIFERSRNFIQELQQRKDREIESLDVIREQQHAEAHRSYLQTLDGKPDDTDYSIVGSYTIDCPSINEEWDERDEMVLSIQKAQRGGIFEAGFRFRLLEGVMILSTNRALLVAHRNTLDKTKTKEKDWDWNYLQDPAPTQEDGEEGQDNDAQAGAGAKRRASGAAGTRGKKRKSSGPQVNPRRFWLMWQGFETGEGQMQSDHMDNTGCIEFSDDRFTSFRGEMNLKFVSGEHKFSGRKLSDQPTPGLTMGWDKFENENYEYVYM
ncbi:hypothetical protein F4810DRAFT_429907 [Camillea tinctor]|nr:hypothetical protein F4810DRAFT_429907 [Camillea tinctor]